jgi:hypothetical protein
MNRHRHPHLSAALLSWLILCTAAPQALAFTSTPGTDGPDRAGAVQKDASTISAAHPTGQARCAESARGASGTGPSGTTLTFDPCSTFNLQPADIGQTTPAAAVIPIAGTATNTTDPNYLLNPWVTHASGDMPSPMPVVCPVGSACAGKTDSTTSTTTATGTGTFYATSAQPVSSTVTATNTSTVTATNYSLVQVLNGGVTAARTLSSADVTGALTYTPMNNSVTHLSGDMP